MRVLFVTHNFPRHDGDAAGSFLLRLAHALREAGVDVSVVAPSAAGLPERHVVAGIDVTRFRYASRAHETLAYTGNMAADVRASWTARAALAGLMLSSARAARREAMRIEAEVVHAHWWFPSALAATIPGALAGRPLVVTSHGSDIRLARGTAAARPLLSRVARRTTEWTFVSRWLRDEAAALGPMPRVDVIPMPVAVDRFAPPAAHETRDGLLFVGRLNEQKGVADLLRAAARQHVPLPITIVGDGPDRDALRALADSLGVAARVSWLPAVTSDMLPRLYAHARGLVVPSREEGLGLVAVEAQLCETPVVAYASGGLVDVVTDETNGLLVTPGDLDALAAAMDRLAADEPLRRALGARARPLALAAFGPESVAQRYRAVYARALDTQVARGRRA